MRGARFGATNSRQRHLVDFRAIDTFGEIAVVAIAGLACWALIRLRPRRPDRTEDGVEPAASSGD